MNHGYLSARIGTETFDLALREPHFRRESDAFGIDLQRQLPRPVEKGQALLELPQDEVHLADLDESPSAIGRLGST